MKSELCDAFIKAFSDKEFNGRPVRVESRAGGERQRSGGGGRGGDGFKRRGDWGGGGGSDAVVPAEAAIRANANLAEAIKKMILVVAVAADADSDVTG